MHLKSNVPNYTVHASQEHQTVIPAFSHEVYQDKPLFLFLLFFFFFNSRKCKPLLRCKKVHLRIVWIILTMRTITIKNYKNINYKTSHRVHDCVYINGNENSTWTRYHRIPIKIAPALMSFVFVTVKEHKNHNSCSHGKN